MPSFISSIEYKKLEKNFRKILEKIHVKHVFYKMLIVPSQEIALHKLRKIVNNSPNLEKKNTGKKIIFNSVDGRYMVHTYLEGGIAKSLQFRGHQPKMLICGGALNMCTTFHRIDHPPNPWSCKNCINFSKKFYEITGLDYSTYCDYFNGEKLEEPIIIGMINIDGTDGAILGVIKTDDIDEELRGKKVKAVFKSIKKREGTLKDIFYFTKK